MGKNRIESCTVSVVVPVYNVENYLDETINSILNQTYSNLEVLLVDDGSMDSSGAICDNYSKKDIRIRVIHKDNGGVVSARKLGTEKATGKYITMIDGDDWISPEYIEHLCGLAEENHVGIVTSGLMRDYKDGTESYADRLPEGLYDEEKFNNVKNNIIFYEGMTTEYGIRGSIVGKLVNSDFLKSIYSDMEEEIETGDDWAVTYPLIFNTKCFFVSHKCLYHYVQRESSITHSVNKNYMESMQKWYDFVTRKIIDINNPGIKKQIDVAFVMLVLRGVNYYMGLNQDVCIPEYVLPCDLPPGDVVLYGAGKVGKAYYSQLRNDDRYKLVAWVDKKWDDDLDEKKRVNYIEQCRYDYILIAINYENVANTIKNDLIQNYNVAEKSVLWKKPKKILDNCYCDE